MKVNMIISVFKKQILLIRIMFYRELFDLRKGLSGHYRWFMMRKLGRSDLLRCGINYIRQKCVGSLNLEDKISKHDSIFKDIDIENAVDSLNKYGVFTGLKLPDHIVNDILEFAYCTPCYANGKPDLEFYYKDKKTVETKNNKMKILIADYFNTSQSCKAIKMISEDPILRKIAQKHLGGVPIHQGNKLWWSFPVELGLYDRFKYGQTFHYDLDDYSALKIFFYLTDVDLKNGPHVYVLGTHKKKKWIHQIFRHYISDQSILNYYKQENVKMVCEQAGRGFIEDAFCLHKGTYPETSDRLMLSVEFALRDYGMQHDTYANPVKVIV